MVRRAVVIEPESEPSMRKSPFKSPTKSPLRARRGRSAQRTPEKTPTRVLRPRKAPATAGPKATFNHEVHPRSLRKIFPHESSDEVDESPDKSSPTKPLRSSIRRLALTTPPKAKTRPRRGARELDNLVIDLTTDFGLDDDKENRDPRRMRTRPAKTPQPPPPKEAAVKEAKTPKKKPKTPAPTAKTTEKKAKKKAEKGLAELGKELHASVLPSALLCREEELARLETFIGEAVEEGRSAAIYISGVPGTGKTASVLSAIASLRSRASSLPPFDFLQINGMNFTDPHQLYPFLYGQLRPGEQRSISASRAQEWLDHHFRETPASDRKPLVLLVDELDQLMTRRQDVLYQIFEWASHHCTRLIVLAVANTLDLPERLLKERVCSRLGPERMCFQPYDFAEICTILKARLSDSGAVEADAVELLSRKVASSNGDLRMALDLAAAAVAEAAEAGESVLTTARLHALLSRLKKTPRSQWLASLPIHAKLFLQAFAAESQRTGQVQLRLSAVASQYYALASEATPAVEAVERLALVRIVASLVDAQILLAANSASLWHRHLQPNFPLQDVQFHLN